MLIKGPTRDQMLAYIEATLIGKSTKKDAYLKHVNPDIKQANLAVARMEKLPEYQELYSTIATDDNLKMQTDVQRVQRKYVNLIEKNIDTMNGILDDVKNAEVKDKAVAVRLANETVGAMSIVDGPKGPQHPGTLNKAAAVIE